MEKQPNTAREITLEEWASEKFGERAPHIGTLRRWARDGKIYPAPRKVGRDWLVRPHADYVTNYSDIARVQRESQATQ
jgi:hypothetical protein